MSHATQQFDALLDAAQHVVDRCSPVVPSAPLVALTERLTNLDLDDEAAAWETPGRERLYNALAEVAEAWSFWPPTAYGSTVASGPSAEQIDELRWALDAVRAERDT